MPAKRELSMRQLRHLLRLHHDGVSAREIGRRLGEARSTIQDNLKRAAAAGLARPLADDVTDDALECQLFGRAGVTQGQRRRVELQRARRRSARAAASECRSGRI
jgi:ParB-like chromosome segregation protein Spo0J